MWKRLLLALGLSVIALRPVAAADTILLWSPGSEGSAEQAAPLLDSWMDYLENKGLDASLQAVYRNTAVSVGSDQLKKLKPVAGIISLEAYLALADQKPLTLLLQTRKLPSGNGTSQYVIVKNKMGPEPESLVLSEPLGVDFVQKVVLSEAPQSYKNLPRQFSDQVLFKLKKVGQGELNAAVLISDYQAAVLKQLPSQWAKNLEVVISSPVLPAPPLVLFQDWKGSFQADKFKQLLLEMEQDPEGQAILQELRLKGFIAPDATAYQKWQEALRP